MADNAKRAAWPDQERITAERVILEPLSIRHATEMVDVLADASVYAFTEGEAPSLARLESRYTTQTAGRSPDGSQQWLNWIVRRQDSDAAVGFVQATVERIAGGAENPTLVANLAWVVAPAHRGQGIASEATGAMIGWLRLHGVGSFAAFIRPNHFASIGVARNQGLHPTSIAKHGETRWES
ncbi:MAG: GNAT family N-acetyltransferase [Microbacteriaceae bacterium]